jgi:hypothetical protein
VRAKESSKILQINTENSFYLKMHVCECGKECKNKQAYSAHKRGCSALPKNDVF